MGVVNKNFGDVFTFVRGSEATYYDSSGIIQSAAVDEPRFTHDPVTGQSQGVLLEPGATNLLSWSETNGSNWPISDNVTHWANTPVVIRGITLDRYTRDSISILDLPSTSNTATVSVFFHDDDTDPGDTQVIRLVLRDGSGNSLSQRVITFSYTSKNFGINTEDGTESWSVTNLGDGLYHVVLTIDNPSLSNVGFVRVAIYGNNRWIGGFMLTDDPFPSSYIKTQGSPVTRDVDTLARIVGEEFNPNEGVLLIEYTPSVLSGEQNLMLFRSPSSSPIRCSVHEDGTYRVNGVSIISPPIAASGQTDKLAVRYINGVVTLCVNGVLQGSASGQALLSDVVQILIGRSTSNSNTLIGTVSRAKYYRRALTDAKLQEITA